MHEVLLKKVRRAKGDIALGIGSILVSLFFIVEARRIRDGKNVMVSAKLFPRIYAGFMGICALWVLISGIRKYLSVPKEIREQDKITKEHLQGLLRVFEVFGVLLLTAIFYKPLGFLLVTPFTMFFMFIILEEPEKRNYKLFVLLSIVCPIVVYFAFYYLFSNLLPMGVLKPILYSFI